MSINALLLLLVVPIAVIGWRMGPWPAGVAAGVAMGLVVAHSVGGDAPLGPLAYLNRVIAFATVALLAGALHRSSPPRGTGPAAHDGVDGVLTKREREVLARMAAGETNAQIAAALVIAESTVKSHVKNILRKLDAHNRTEAVSRYLGSTNGQHAESMPEAVQTG